MDESEIKELLFPHDSVRNVQDDLIREVSRAVKEKRNLIVHAPTGLGKTAAALAPALSHAIKNNLSIFFLTSRHTQHVIAIDTLKKIKEKYGLSFSAADIIGKKWMCPVPGTDTLYSNEFSEYCKKQREDYKCEFFVNTKAKGGKLKPKAQKVLEELKQISPSHVEKVTEICADEKICPYEMATTLAAEATVIIADYNYVFNPSIMQSFFTKAKKELEKTIIIVDEGHNLSNRLREQMTERLSNVILKRAIKEAQKHSTEGVVEQLDRLMDIIEKLSEGLRDGEEKMIEKEEFVKMVKELGDYEQVMADLEFAGDDIRESQKQSYVGSVAGFLDKWLGADKGFARILTVKRMDDYRYICLSYRCLDPSLATRDVITNAHSTIMMSGTLTPTSMYRDIMGFPENTTEKEYSSPFPEKNKLCLIVPETTTKYSARSEEQFKKIAEVSAKMINLVPGNTAMFFPSYGLRDKVYKYFSNICEKTTFLETPNLSKQEKQDMLDEFKRYKDHGAALLGVAAGSFGEGIDLPGDLLKAVIVVGLPLQVPDLETKELISYYDDKFQKGWDYGYVLPAITKSLQNAGRCIRSETDRGAIIFLDERYAWPNYKRCFPVDWDVKVTKLYQERIKEFFGK